MSNDRPFYTAEFSDTLCIGDSTLKLIIINCRFLDAVNRIEWCTFDLDPLSLNIVGILEDVRG